MGTRFTSVTRLGRWLRAGWLMFGVLLLILVGIEVGYRAQAAARRVLRPEPAFIKAPYADSAWFANYRAEYRRTFQLHWKPYVYYRRPAFAGAFIHVDSLGHRRTIPGPRVAAETVRVFFFGGSTMWGSYLRDSATIASIAARRLNKSAPAGVTFAVTNYGESEYVSTQEMIELEMQLRAGNIPQVVVFYDGINDVAAAVQTGEAGLPEDEVDRSKEFEFDRDIFGTETDAGSDRRAARAIGAAVLGRLQFVQRLGAAVRSSSIPPTPPRLPRDIVQVYASNADAIEALSRTYGFRALYVWQPSLQTTPKKLTPFEDLMARENRDNEFQRRVQNTQREVESMLDSAISSRVGSRFINESKLFAGDTISVFSDNVSHNTEKSIPAIVDGFYPRLAALVDSARIASRRARASAGHVSR